MRVLPAGKELGYCGGIVRNTYVHILVQVHFAYCALPSSHSTITAALYIRMFAKFCKEK
jgi:hypothetical protein